QRRGEFHIWRPLNVVHHRRAVSVVIQRIPVFAGLRGLCGVAAKLLRLLRLFGRQGQGGPLRVVAYGGAQGKTGVLSANQCGGDQQTSRWREAEQSAGGSTHGQHVIRGSLTWMPDSDPASLRRLADSRVTLEEKSAGGRPV